ncbi:hypothetical protein FQR65_LT14059 [Abscondita terminalis]|nr:hypothetical protein FQR65_LT14059 [Abscondita terminalis]
MYTLYNCKSVAQCVRKNCRARASCSSDDKIFLKLGDNHNHLPEERLEEALQVKDRMVAAAVTTSRDIRSIFVEQSARYLECVRKNCRARASCSSDDKIFLKLGDNHNHLPEERLEEALQVKDRMVAAAVTTSRDIRSIFVEQSARYLECVRKNCRARASCSSDDKIFLKLGDNHNHLPEERLEEALQVKDRMVAAAVTTSRDIRSIFVEQSARYLECVRKNCRARASCSSDDKIFLKLGDNHNHLPEERLEEALQVKDRMVAAAVTTSRDIRSIFVEQSARYLECVRKNCRARASCSSDDKIFLKLGDNHNHLPEERLEEALQVKDRMVAAAVTTSRDIRSIFVEQSARKITLLTYSRADVDASSQLAFPAISQYCLRELSAITIREIRGFVDHGLQVRSMSKRKYRINNRRIQVAMSQLESGQLELESYLGIVSHTTNNIVEENLSFRDDITEDEEYLLGTLEAYIPQEYALVDNDSSDEQDEQPDNGLLGTDDLSGSGDPASTSESAVEVTNPERSCMICQVNLPSKIIIPCMHFGFCDTCADEYERRNEEFQRPDEELGYVINYSICPIDRTPIERLARVLQV